jgi:uncharacterized protein DUF1501
MNPCECGGSEHVTRRALLKGTVLGAAGMALGNWGALFNSETIAQEVQKKPKRCILLWMAGGASHLDTFDMKPGRAVAGPFRPIGTNVPGIQVCEYLPRIAKQADKLAIIRSMSTSDPEHSGGTYLMHTGYRKEGSVTHPEIGGMVAKYLGDPGAELPSFIQIGGGGGESSPVSGAGFLGPLYQPFKMGGEGRMPENTSPYLAADADKRRNELLKFMDEDFAREHHAQALKAYREADEKSRRLLKAKAAFDLTADWEKYKGLYGDSRFGKNCLMARKLIESGVPFVEVEQENYDSHSDNFEWHKALLPVLDQAWSALLVDLDQRGLLKDTLVVWMGEFGRTPTINNRAGRDHYAKAWTVVLSGGGVKGGLVHGATDEDGRTVKEKPVSSADLFATVYTVLGVNPRAKHFIGTRPVWATPEDATVVRDLLA